MRPLTQIITLLTLVILKCHAQGTTPLKLWYKQPATQWEEALPIGNGPLAAMIFGGVTTEQIQFNEETLWTGEPRSYAHKGASAHLGEIRRLLNEGKQKEAEALANEQFMSQPMRQMAYQAFGDVYLDFPGHGEHTAYNRELDLQTATVKSSYEAGGIRYTRKRLRAILRKRFITILPAHKRAN
jgi:alpha-L-fucosidase 2